MKKNLLIAISLIAIVTSCTSKIDTTFRIEGNVDTKNGPRPAIWYTDQINFNGDSLYYINSDSSRVDIAPPYEILVNEEKHFDCIVESCENDGNQYMVTTECGIVFYSNSPNRIGEALKNFKSPKHK